MAFARPASSDPPRASKTLPSHGRSLNTLAPKSATTRTQHLLLIQPPNHTSSVNKPASDPPPDRDVTAPLARPVSTVPRRGLRSPAGQRRARCSRPGKNRLGRPARLWTPRVTGRAVLRAAVSDARDDERRGRGGG